MPPLPALTGPLLLLAGYALIVALLTAYTHWIWRSRGAAPLTSASAAEAFRREHGDGDVRDVLVLADRRTALVRTDAGELGVVRGFGRGWSVRLIDVRDIRAVRRSGADGIKLLLRDYAHPSLTLRFPSRDAERAWVGAILEAHA